MGGNSGIYYGTMVLTDTPNEGQTRFEFTAYDIDGNDGSKEANIPNINDLILNKDGCFYRVVDVYGKGYEAIIATEKLTIAGSGGGGGGTGGSGSGSAFINVPASELSKTILKGSPYSITFNYKATDGQGELTGSANYVIKVDGVQKGTGVVHQGENSIPVDKFLPQARDNSYKIRLEIQADVGAFDYLPIAKQWNIKVVEMKLTWNYDETKINKANENITLSWKVSGLDLEKKTYITIDDAYTIESEATTSIDTQTLKINPSQYNLGHGVHTFAMRAGTDLGGTVSMTDSVYKNFIIVEEDNTLPIISIGLFTDSLTQYNTVQIPIILYKSDNINNNAEIILKENGNEKDRWTNIANSIINYWSYTPSTSGTITLSAQCGSTEVNKIIDIIKLDIDNKEIEDYAFRFKASDFASNNAIQAWKKDEDTKEPWITFSEKFDWINGGLKNEKDENNRTRQYMAVKAGSTMTINYPLFEQSAKNGKTIKIIFKSVNCRDYDAHILSCKNDKKVIFIDKENAILLDIDNGVTLTYADNAKVKEDYSIELINSKTAIYDITDQNSRTAFNNKFVSINGIIYQCVFNLVEGQKDIYYASWNPILGKDSFEGLSLTAQSATYNSKNNTISTQYCEDSYIELELDISKFNDKKSYIKFWVDGVPSGFVVYEKEDDFTDSNKNFITIGSVDCDTYIYMIKVYEKSLTDTQHLENFIADAPNAEDMLDRYRRNDILNSRGEIDPQKLAAANKDCLVHLYEIERMTKTKKDKIKGCTYDQYHGSEQPVLHAENVTIKVQGTSSEKYVVAAANLDSEFEDGFTDLVNNKHIDGWSMDGGNAIPINFFCTKVNVASCENANNAMNQEWYNMFQPYKTVLSFKNKKARDTMQFTNGVLFLKDLNPKYDTSTNADKKENNVFGEIDGYISQDMESSAYYKMYSLANMGNSKDNIEVFHDTTNPKECCIEVGDNQTQQQWMVSDVYNKDDIGKEEGYFEFRYPEDDATQEMKDAWNAFVSWMAHSNPQPKYEKHTATTEKEFRSFAFNQKTQKDIPVFIMNEAKTAYIPVVNFNPNNNTYYTETEHIYGYTNLKLSEDLTAEDRTFEPYTFKGFKAQNQVKENGELWQKDYKPLIAGCTISDFATKYQKPIYKKDENGNFLYDNTGKPIIDGYEQVDEPYEYDTYEYRMAKMLSECEDHLVMDSVIYHYLFIERHCMIDNVAKNTFWSTEDCQHWFLNKDYDNDTADGNDNNGKFTRTYGMEVMDKLNANTYVFNARQSVWLNFIHGLKTAREHMYQQLESNSIKYGDKTLNIWSKDDYLWLFKKWQSIIPERCWIEDYYRKYFRPYELYNDTMFISMMEGGQKSHQRTQYETYQETYMSSEYNGDNSRSSYIIIRPNGDNMEGYELPTTVYSDCYIRMDLGSSSSVQRVKRKEKANFICPQNNLNNATMYLYPAKAISTLGEVGKGELGDFAPEQISLTSAGKLRELVLAVGGSDKIKNETLKTGLSINNNVLLEKLYAANFSAYEGGLDLSQCPNLLELDARGSTFRAIKIADNAPVVSIKLENPTSLSLSNLSELQTLDIVDPTRISLLEINNIDKSNINSKDIVEKVYGSNEFSSYKLTDVDWIMNQENDVDETNNTIRLLEYLLTKQTVDEYNPATEKWERIPKSAALIGNLLIDEKAYNGADSFDIYEKYVNEDRYLNLNIDFNGSEAKLFDVTVYDANGKVYWTKKALKGTSIDENFYIDGPYGKFIVPESFKDSKYTYTFEGKWNVKYDDGTIETIVKNVPTLEGLIGSNIEITPVFTTTINKYLVTIYSDNQIYFRDYYDYGTTLQDITKKLTPYKDDSLLEKEKTYKMKGYAISETYANQGIILENLNKIIITSEVSYYAAFDIINVYDNIIDNKYLKYEKYNNGWSISIKDEYRNIIKGKITLPVSYNNEPILQIKDFSRCDMTHVFFDNKEECKIKIIGKETAGGTDYTGFRACQNLKYFEIMPSMKIIGERAFSARWDSTVKDSNLFNITNNNLEKFFENIEEIKNYAFLGCKWIKGIVNFSGNLKYIGKWGFYGAGITSGIFGNSDNPSHFYENENDRNYISDKMTYAFDSTPLSSVYFYVENLEDMNEARQSAIKEDFKGDSISFGYGQDHTAKGDYKVL